VGEIEAVAVAPAEVDAIAPTLKSFEKLFIKISTANKNRLSRHNQLSRAVIYNEGIGAPTVNPGNLVTIFLIKLN